MRDLSRSEKNELTIHDRLSGTDIVLYYRQPETSEQATYQRNLVKRKGKKVLINAFETRLEAGLKIITGFREGDFGVDGKPISSDPKSPHYREDWKDLLKETAADIVTTLAFTVFESASVDMGDDIEYEEAGEAAPLPKSSDAS